jgi:hypothetical protein
MSLKERIKNPQQQRDFYINPSYRRLIQRLRKQGIETKVTGSAWTPVAYDSQSWVREFRSRSGGFILVYLQWFEGEATATVCTAVGTYDGKFRRKIK